MREGGACNRAGPGLRHVDPVPSALFKGIIRVQAFIAVGKSECSGGTGEEGAQSGIFRHYRQGDHVPAHIQNHIQGDAFRFLDGEFQGSLGAVSGYIRRTHGNGIGSV